MPETVGVRSSGYTDSVVLMQIAEQARGVDGVSECVVAMATELNLALLTDLGFSLSGVQDAAPSDTIVAVRGADEDSLRSAWALIDSQLAGSRPTAGRGSPGRGGYATMHGAVAASGANLAVISVPGPHAAAEAADAIRAGASVMIFSDGVALAEERRLKELADDRGLLVMGPDCGTAAVAGIGLGFVNEVSRGNVGVVAASGTGAQHLMCLLDAWDVGVSHVIGVGGRDLCDEIGGVSTARALKILDEDPATAHIAVVAKQAGRRSCERIRALAAELHTPVTLGLPDSGAVTLTSLAARVAGAPGELFRHRHERAVSAAPLAGLFSGGALAGEATAILSAQGHRIASVDAFGPAPTPQAVAACQTDFIVDLGDDRFTAGRPHPMIDPYIRRAVIGELAARPEGRHLLIDVVLGHSAHPDPAGALAPSIQTFLRGDRGRSAVAAVIGTSRDPQGRDRQRRSLIDAGCDVFESNAEAATEIAGRLAAEPA